MTIDEFVDRFVEGYIFGDLESMSHIRVPRGEKYGGVGYPMVATILAGMELLGGLLAPSTRTFDPNAGNDNFLNYWDNYFAKQYPAYSGLGRLFRQLMRNGVSHTFVAKPGMLVEKGTGRQMSIDTVNSEVYIDCNIMYKEFRESYDRLVRPIIDGNATSPTTREAMQSRLEQLSTAYSSDSVRLFSQLPQPLNPVTIDTQIRKSVLPSTLAYNSRPRASGPSLALKPSGPLRVISVTTQSMPGQDGPTGPMPRTTDTTTVPFNPTLSGTITPTDEKNR